MSKKEFCLSFQGFRFHRFYGLKQLYLFRREKSTETETQVKREMVRFIVFPVQQF